MALKRLARNERYDDDHAHLRGHVEPRIKEL